MQQPREIYTIGHSTRSIEEFITLLQAHGIEKIIDIRTIPHSKHNPQFEQEELKTLLKHEKMGYRHLKELGGLRHPNKNSTNIGWKNASFRGFADYMQTTDFWNALEKLEELACKKKCAIMCAEAVPWRCHRSLVADALTYHKWDVFHIQSKKTAKKHVLTSFLKVINNTFIYSP